MNEIVNVIVAIVYLEPIRRLQNYCLSASSAFFSPCAKPKVKDRSEEGVARYA